MQKKKYANLQFYYSRKKINSGISILHAQLRARAHLFSVIFTVVLGLSAAAAKVVFLKSHF